MLLLLVVRLSDVTSPFGTVEFPPVQLVVFLGQKPLQREEVCMHLSHIFFYSVHMARPW